VKRTKVLPACLLGIAWIASFLILAPSAARGKINIARLVEPYAFLAHRPLQLHFCGETGSNADERASTVAMDVGTWRLVQTPGRGGPGEVSIAQTAR
jgi:hypothetical protein